VSRGQRGGSPTVVIPREYVPGGRAVVGDISCPRFRNKPEEKGRTLRFVLEFISQKYLLLKLGSSLVFKKFWK
jgi:hypothetical protein